MMGGKPLVPKFACPHIIQRWETEDKDVPEYRIRWKPVLYRCHITVPHNLHRAGPGKVWK